MSSPADWYPDPSRPGRLRYWDGSSWSEWVSDADGTSADPLANPLSFPPPAPEVAPPPGAARRVGDREVRADLLARSGIGLAAVAGVIALVAAGKVLVQQPAPVFVEGDLVVKVGPAVWTAAVGAVLLAVCAALPWLWARFTGVGLAGLLAVSLAFSVIGWRSADRFLSSGPDVALGTGGKILVAAAFVAFAGTAIALVGMGWLATETRRGRTWPGLATTSLVLGIVGLALFVVVAQPLAVAFGVFGMGGFARGPEAGGRGRGLAIAGFVLGLVGLGLWWIGMSVGMFAADPSPPSE